MKKLMLSVLLLAGCKNAPAVPEPQPAVPVGTQLRTPCEVHGEDVWTVDSVQRIFVYNLVNQDGVTVQADEATVLQVLLDNQPK